MAEHPKVSGHVGLLVNEPPGRTGFRGTPTKTIFATDVTDDDDLPDLIAQKANERHEPPVPWDALTHRARKRLRYKAKKWLNTRAVERMTVERLAARDPGGEVRAWLATIARLGGR